jgi:hypothetical protein
VNAVSDRPEQSPEEVRLILKTLQWTIHPDGKAQKRKRWNITNGRDAHTRAFTFKLLMGDFSQRWHDKQLGTQRWTIARSYTRVPSAISPTKPKSTSTNVPTVV